MMETRKSVAHRMLTAYSSLLLLAFTGQPSKTLGQCQSPRFPDLRNIRFADQFPGVDVTARIAAAANDLGGARGLVIVPSAMGTGLIPILPEKASVLDLRGPSLDGGIQFVTRTTRESYVGANFAIQNSADRTNGIALYGDARAAGQGTNVVGVEGVAASSASAGVFGYNEGSGGFGGVGVQGDSANLPGGTGVRGTTATSGSTPAKPSIGVLGEASGHAIYGAAVGGLFTADNAPGLVVVSTAAATSGIDPQVLKVVGGLDTSTNITIQNVSTGGKRWDLTSTGARDPKIGAAGWLYFLNVPDNRAPLAIDPAAPSTTLVVGASGVTARALYSDSAITAGVNTVSFSTVPTFDASAGNIQKITLTSNVTSSTLSNGARGQLITFIICQDAQGNRSFAWPSNVKGGMNIGSTPSRCSAQSFVFDGTNAYALGVGVANM